MHGSLRMLRKAAASMRWVVASLAIAASTSAAAVRADEEPSRRAGREVGDALDRQTRGRRRRRRRRVAAGNTPGNVTRRNHGVAGELATPAGRGGRGRCVESLRSDDAACIASSSSVAAVTSGPAPGPLKNRFETWRPSSRMPFSAPPSDASGSVDGRNAGPTNARTPVVVALGGDDGLDRAADRSRRGEIVAR